MATAAPKRVVKVAVIGSGLAGLTCTHLLTQPLVEQDDTSGVVLDVHLFEKSSTLGMDAESISVSSKQLGTDVIVEQRIDVPMRSFQGGYYPNVEKLYRKLGVSFRPADFSYSFSSLSKSKSLLGRTISTWFIYNGSSGRAGLGIPSSFRKDRAQRPLPLRERLGLLLSWLFSTILVSICFLRLLWLSLPIWKTRKLKTMTFEEWACDTRLRSLPARLVGLDVAWGQFLADVLLPLFSAVCTAPIESVWDHPVEEFLDYVWLTLGTPHYKVTHGVQDVVRKLTNNNTQLHIGCEILSICPDPKDANRVIIHCAENGVDRRLEGFDHIVLATQAFRAVPLLSSYMNSLSPDTVDTPTMRTSIRDLLECLQSFKYHRNIVINHTDSTLLPDDPLDWRELNLIVAGSQFTGDEENDSKEGHDNRSRVVDPSFAMATHILSAGSCSGGKVYQTTNPVIAPKEETILSVSVLERAVVTVGSKKALSGLWTQDSLGMWETAIQRPSQLGHLQGTGRLRESHSGPGIWICGSYAYAGIPLLEGCVVSARNVAEQGILRCEGASLKEEPW